MRQIFLLLCTPLLLSAASGQNNATAKEYFTATLKISAVTVSKSFDADRNLQGRQETEQRYEVKQGYHYLKSLMERLQSRTQRLELCASESSCVLMTGTSRALDVNAPVVYSVSIKSWSRCKDGMMLTGVSEGSGTLTDYSVGSMISVIQRTKDDLPEAAPLVKDSVNDVEAVPLVNPDYYIRLFVNIGGFTPNINPDAPKLKSRTYDCETKKWTDLPPDPRYGLSVPDFTVLRRILKNGTNEVGAASYVMPVFREKELTEFLKRPANGKTFSMKAKSRFSNDAEETETNIAIELVFE